MHVNDLDVMPGELAVARQTRAIGWLDVPEHSRGRMSAEVFGVLMAHCADAWQPWRSAGRYSCKHCVHSGGPGVVTVGDHAVRMDGRNLFIPTQELLYVAPIMIVHYIDAHAYLPPEPFVEALLACPPMRSVAYLKMLHDLGVRAKLDAR